MPELGLNYVQSLMQTLKIRSLISSPIALYFSTSLIIQADIEIFAFVL